MSKISNFIKSVFGVTEKKEVESTPILKQEPIQKRTLKDVRLQIMNPYSQEFAETKQDFVRKHLIEKGSIDSWTAIELYGATRLSAIIFKLRNRGMNIISVPCSALDRNSNVCNYTTYKLNQ